jgi:hypothetical protein
MELSRHLESDRIVLLWASPSLPFCVCYFGSIYHVLTCSYDEVLFSSKVLLRENFMNLIMAHNKQFAEYVYYNC